ncbi:MAG: peptide chain release factor 2 [Hyphomicrobiales bacterium]|nr:peptide chain release factor 2 [Hyphomicrobiales bacterium]
MRAEAQNLFDDIKQALTLLRRHLDWDASQKRLSELNTLAEDPGFWNDPRKAQKLMRERQQLEVGLSSQTKFETELSDTAELIELGEGEGDEEMVAEATDALKALQKAVEQRRVEAMFSGEADPNDAYVEFHPGAGGTESQDWAEMLLRMYTRWGERHRFKVELLEASDGEGAGIKSATLLVKGDNAYGWLKTEAGVHRLVRISPFDANARRQTSFVSVDVYPVVDDTIDIEVKESDCRVDTYRASGAGGQKVNKTDSAVRITHMPSGVVVACQSERSQHQNRATAWTMLKARLYEIELKKREDAMLAEHNAKTEIGWGHQIRSYVLQPYQMVKDLRTGVVSNSPQDVLNGDLDTFIEATLSQRVFGGAPVKVDDVD